MGKIQKEWARRKRAEYKERLGGKCLDCGTTEKLEFDCKVPQGDKHHKMDTSHRMSFYRVQIALDNIELRCETCHSKKSANEQQKQVREPDPF